MSLDTEFGGTADTELVNLSGTSVTALLTASDSDYLIHSIMYASAAGDALVLDTHDGTTASRLRKVTIAADADGAFTTPFILMRGHSIRGTLTTGNATAIRISYTIKSS